MATKRLASLVSTQLLRQRAFSETGLATCRLIGTAASVPEADPKSKPGSLPLVAFSLGAALLGLHSTARCDAAPSTKEDLKPPENPYAKPHQLKGLPKKVVLYQYEVCPFCCKVKAFLDYHKIPYQTVEVNPLFKKELKSWSTYSKVPVALLDEEPIADSSAIISRLAAEIQGPAAPEQHPDIRSSHGWFFSSPKTVGAEPAASSPAAADAEEGKWRRWVDERYVRVITVNIYRSAKETFQAFDYIAENGNFNVFERQGARVFGAGMMWAVSGRLRKKYGITRDVREELYIATDEWLEALGDRPFLGGDAPNLADLAVFGVVRSVTGSQTFHDLMHNTGIGGWYERMMKAVGDSSRVAAV